LKEETKKELKDKAKNFLSRKIIITLYVISLATGFVFAKYMNINQWMDLMKWTLGIYVAGNVGSKGVNKLQINGKNIT
jgi:hypothetical protein